MLGLAADTINAYQAKDYGIIDCIAHQKQISIQAMAWLFEQSKKPQKPLKFWANINIATEKKSFENLWLNSEHKEVLRRF